MTDVDAATYLDALATVTADRGIPAEARQAIIQGARALRNHDALAMVVAEMMGEADMACNPHSADCETEAEEGCTCWYARALSALTNARKVP